MIQRMVTSALFAGFAAGLLAALLHFAFVQKLILLGEGYESGAVQHFGGVAVDAHGHDAASATDSAPAETAGDGHDSHSHEPAAPAENRNAMTSLFFGLTYIAYALLLTAGFGLAQVYGKAIGLREGLLWGLAGFAAFQLAPAMGLAPELPGTMAADLTARQLWWLGTAVSTGLALAVLGYGKGALSLALAALLLALPHVIGAPHPEGFSGVAPPELAAAFATRSLGVGLIVWAALGALAGQFWSGKPL
ncbi:MAG: cobalt transporter, subunit CbtA [uncultured bacterium]|nr:MAG: cobalt transporter, subunit CbtA [uncultured bacterium]